MSISDERKAQLLAAEERARKVLMPGDRITFTHCPGTKRHGIFTGWDGRWICIKTRDDIHASNISKVNGKPVDFNTKPSVMEK